MVVQKLCELLRIRTRFLSMYVYIYIIHGYTYKNVIHQCRIFRCEVSLTSNLNAFILNAGLNLNKSSQWIVAIFPSIAWHYCLHLENIAT